MKVKPDTAKPATSPAMYNARKLWGSYSKGYNT